MQRIINDMELDVHELKLLLDVIAKDPNQGLNEIAERRIQNIHLLLEQLSGSLHHTEPEETDNQEEPYPPQETSPITTEAPTPTEEPLATETPEEIVEEEVIATEEEEEEEEEEIEEQPTPSEPTTEPAVETQEETISLMEDSSVILAERLRTSGSLKDSLSLNDSFRFSGELFGGDIQRMNHTLAFISEMSSLKNVISYLETEKLDKENEAYPEFMEMLHKYFN